MVYFDKADKVLGSLMAIVSCIAVVGCIRALILFIRQRFVHRKKFSHITFLFINLIISDLFSGTFNSSFMALNLINGESDSVNRNSTSFQMFCNISGISYIITAQTSVLINAILSYGRYIAVCKSLRYSTLITTKKIYIAVTIAWIYSIYLAILPYMWKVNYMYFEGIALQIFLFLTIIVLPSLIPATIVMTCCILIICRLNSGSPGQLRALLCCGVFRDKAQKHDLQHAQRMELVDAARSVLRIVVLFVCCYFFWWLKMLLDFLEFVGAVPFGWTKSLWGDTANGYYNRTLIMMMLANSAMTPFLLVSFNSGKKALPINTVVPDSTAGTVAHTNSHAVNHM